MLRKNGFHHKIEVVLNKPVFLAYRIPTVRHPSVVVHTFKLEYMYLWSQLANLDQIYV